MRAVVWPSAGVSEVVERDEPAPGPGDVVVDVAVSVLSPGTERARLLDLPTARVPFPHTPGYLAAGRVRTAGTRVAVRGAAHGSVAVAPAPLVRAVPDRVPLVDAAVWQLALTARYGMALGGHRPGAPATVVGAGLLGVVLRRLLAAEGTPTVLAVAGSTAKAWAAEVEPATTFHTADRLGSRSPLTFDVTGAAAGLSVAVAATADAGRVVLLGSPRARTAEVPLRELYDRRITLVGAHTVNLHATEVPTLSDPFFALLDAGRFTVQDVLEDHPADAAPELYRRLVDDPAFIGAALRWTTEPTGRRAVKQAVNRAAPRDHPLRFGLIGCGDIGIKDAEAIATASGSALVACHDPLPDLAAEVATHFDARPEPDVAALLHRHDVDAVLIATPHDTHESLAVAAIDAGKHVLLEKPLAQNLRSARRIAVAARASSTVTSVLFPMRTDPRFVQARTAITGGLLGTPLGVSASYLVDKPTSYFHGGFSGRAPSSWRLSKARAGGGFLIMNLVHQLDVVRALLGVEADRVFAELTPSAVAPQIEDVVSVVVRFGPIVATLVGGASVPGGDGQRMRLWGTAGQVEVLPAYRLTTRAPAPEPAPQPDDDPRVRAIEQFVASVRDGTPADVTLHDALAVQAMVEAAYASAGLGRAVAPAHPAGDDPAAALVLREGR